MLKNLFLKLHSFLSYQRKTLGKWVLTPPPPPGKLTLLGGADPPKVFLDNFVRDKILKRKFGQLNFN